MFFMTSVTFSFLTSIFCLIHTFLPPVASLTVPKFQSLFFLLFFPIVFSAMAKVCSDGFESLSQVTCGQLVKVPLMSNIVFLTLLDIFIRASMNDPENLCKQRVKILLLPSETPLFLSALFHLYLHYVVANKVISPKSLCDVFCIYSFFYFPTKSLYATISVFMNRALPSFLIFLF